MQYKKVVLPNGLRVIYVPVKGNPSVTVMALVETGSNYEKKEENGLSHFLEHMVFKGTKKRPSSMHISKELDGLGAESNAFTSNEMTAYWAKGEKKHFKKLLEIISDLYLNPTLPTPDLEKERGVILQEISMYEDLPQRKVWEVFSALLYGDTPHGRTILGPVENIKKFSREEFERYRSKHYVAKKTIIIVSGDIPLSGVLKEVKTNFVSISNGVKVSKEKVKESQKVPQISIFQKKTDQTHLVLGFRTFGAKDKRVATLQVLSAILGKGMSSRLFQKLRDEMGVCYYVRAGSEELTDHGSFVISSGVDRSRVEEVVKVLIEELGKVKNTLVSETELKKAKDYLTGNLFLHLETTDALAEFYLGQEVARGKMDTPKEIEKEIKKVKAKDIQKLAREIFKKEKMNLAIVGEVKDASRLEKLLVI